MWVWAWVWVDGSKAMEKRERSMFRDVGRKTGC